MRKSNIILLILLIFFISCNKKGSTIIPNPNSIDTIITKPDTIPPVKPNPPVIVKTVREKLLDTLENQLYVRETSPNRGPMVDLYINTININKPSSEKTPLGSKWCGAFVGANLFWQNITNPKSAWSPDYAQKKDIIWTAKGKNSITPLTGDVVTFYYSNLGRVGHVGFFIEEDKNGFFITIEGNTNGVGSREGDGVYKKKRDPAKTHAITRYIH